MHTTSRTYLGNFRYVVSGPLRDLEHARDAARQASKTLAEAIAKIALLAPRPEVEEARKHLESVADIPGQVAEKLAVLAYRDEQTEMARAVEIEDSGAWKACVARLSDLTQAIQRGTNQLARRREHPAARHMELMQKGLSRAEADTLCPPLDPAEIAAAQQEIAAMQAERESIGAWLADKPLYRLELLTGPIADTVRTLLDGFKKAA